jgi:hypothetical protein
VEIMAAGRFRRSRFWLQMTGSVVIFVVLLALVDIGEVRRTVSRFDWHFGLWFGLVAAVLIATFAFRWYLLLGRKVSFGNSLYATTVGLGGNMVLPA